MKVLANLMLTVLLTGLLALSHFPFGSARTFPSNSSPVESVNSNYTKQNETTAETTQETNGRYKDTDDVTALPAQTKSLEISHPTVGASSIVHIKRKKRETEVTLPYDFHTAHMPCDFDLPGKNNLIHGFPNQCVWVWNNKFAHEGFFRVYKLYQLEAFFFGQFHERLKRHELDPLVYEY